MTDLYSGLFKQHKRKYKFWGDYESLNDTHIPTYEEIKSAEIEALRTIMALNIAKYDIVNQFIKQAPLMQNVSTAIEDQAEKQIYARIIELLNTGFYSNEENPKRQLDNGYITSKREWHEKNDKIAEELGMLLEQITPNQPINKDIVDTLLARLNSMSVEYKAMADYRDAKADYAEQLMVNIINTSPGFKAVQTGAWKDKEGQLIEDVLIFDENTVNVPFDSGNLQYSIKINGKNKKGSASSTGNLLSQLEKIRGDYQITLSDSLYEAIQRSMVIAGQVKSGMNSQGVLTNASRNSGFLDEFGTFQPALLKQLITLPEKDHWWEKKKQFSNDLIMLANLTLAKGIGNTNLMRNELYYTEKGFVTAADYIDKTGNILRFSVLAEQADSGLFDRKMKYSIFNSI